MKVKKATAKNAAVKKVSVRKADKQLALRAIEEMPDTVSLSQIAEELDILERIRRGEEAADAGDLLPLDQFERHVEQWFTELKSRDRLKLST